MNEVNTINDIINELKRLQIEHGNAAVVTIEDQSIFPAWPEYNEKEKRIEF